MAMAWPARQNEVHGNIKGRWETVDALQISEREGWRANKSDSVTEKIPSSKLRKKNSRGVASNLPTPLPLPPLLVRPSVKHVFMLVKQRTCW